MNILRTLLSATFLATALATAQAQTPPAAPKPDDHTAHDPADAATPAAPAQTAQAAPAPGGAPMGGGMMGAAPGTPGAGGMMGGNIGAMMQEMMPMMRTMMMREGMGRLGGGMMPMMGTRHIEGRIAFLKAELAITDAQLPQWNAFAAVLRANTKTMAGLHATMAKSPPSSAPDRADQMVAYMAARLDTLKTTSAALRTFYGMLSAEQKKSADELLVPGMGRM